MTINEKINNFKERAITDANLQSQSIIHECEENIKKQLEEYNIEKKQLGMKPKEYFHYKGYWEEYLNFLKKEIYNGDN